MTEQHEPLLDDPDEISNKEIADSCIEPSDDNPTGTVAGERLRLFIERVERLEDEKKEVSDQIKEVYAEAKGEGYDTKIVRQIVKLRRMDRADRQEQEALLDLYMSAIGEA